MTPVSQHTCLPSVAAATNPCDARLLQARFGGGAGSEGIYGTLDLCDLARLLGLLTGRYGLGPGCLVLDVGGGTGRWGQGDRQQGPAWPLCGSAHCVTACLRQAASCQISIAVGQATCVCVLPAPHLLLLLLPPQAVPEHAGAGGRVRRHAGGGLRQGDEGSGTGQRRARLAAGAAGRRQ